MTQAIRDSTDDSGSPATSSEEELPSSRPAVGAFLKRINALAIAYVALALIGRLIAVPAGELNLVLPAAGWAFAALTCWGVKFWPGVWIGAFLFSGLQSYASTGVVAVDAALVVATGAALQALLGATLVRPFVEGSAPLSRPRDVFRFLVLAGPVACLLAPTNDVAGHYLLGRLPLDELGPQWLMAWAGNCLGVLLIAPPVFLILPNQLFGRPWRPVQVSVPLLITGVLLLVASTWLSRVETSAQRQAINQDMDAAFEAGIDRLNAEIEILRRIERLFVSSQEVTVQQFSAFVADGVARPGTHFLEWAQRVSRKGRSDFEAQVRREGFPHFRITDPMRRLDDGRFAPAEEREEYFPLRFVEPPSRRELALGMDQMLAPARRYALQKARDTGEATATSLFRSRVTGRAAIVVYLPVYGPGINKADATPAERRQALRGFAVGVFDVDSLFSTLASEADQRNLAVRVVDVTSDRTPVLFRTPAAVASQRLDSPNAELTTAAGEENWTRNLNFGSRRWRVDMAPLQKVWHPGKSLTVQLFLSFSVLAAFLVTYTVLESTGRTATIAAKVTERTLDLSREVVARQTTEAALRESEEDLDITLKSIGDAVLATDTARRVTRMNTIAEQLTGWPPEEAIGRPIDVVFNIVNEETGRPAVIPVDDVLRTGKIHGLANHTKLIARDGRHISIADSAAPIRDARGNTRGVVLVFRDVSQERAAERAIQASEARYRDLVDNCHDLIQSVDCSGKYVYVNRAWCAALGYSQSEAFGLKLPDLVEPDGREHCLEILERLMAGEEVGLIQLAVRAKDGRRIELEGRSEFRFEDGRPVATRGIFRDVTARNQARQQLDALFEMSLDLLCIAGTDGYFKRVNPAFSSTLGWSTQELLERPFIDFVHPDDREATCSELEQLAGGRPTNQFENRYQCRDGSWRWLAWRSMPQQDGVIYASARDVTELKQKAEEVRRLNAELERRVQERTRELRQSEQRYRVTFDMAAIGIADVQLDGQFTRVNPRLCEITGYSEADLLKLLFKDIIHPDDLHQAIRPARKLVSGEISSYSLEIRSVRKDKTVIWTHFTASIVRNGDGEPDFYVVVMDDVTERKQAADRLRASQQLAERSSRRFADLFDFSPDAIVMADRQGVVRMVNRQAEALFGWKRDELIGRPVETLLPAEVRDYHVHLRKSFVDGTQPPLPSADRQHLRGLRRDGTTFPGEVSLGAIASDEGPMIAVAIRDITDRQRVLDDLKRTANELQLANVTIEQERALLAERVAERTAELSAAVKQLEEASRHKSAFLAAMSHELRTPLNGIIGMNQLLLTTDLNDRQREFVEAGEASGRILSQLINDVLDLSKIEAGKLELELRDADLEAIIYDVVDIFSYSARQKGLALNCHIAPQVWMTVRCDENRLRQVFVNLIGNALKFTASGGITVKAELVSRDGNSVRIRFSVIDSGIGISEEQRNRLFEPFTQLDNSTTRRFGGTGLGLSICRQLVGLMGGEIGLDSRIGAGSTFWFEIPLEQIGETRQSIAIQEIPKGMRVLAVDGIDRDRRQVGEYLNSWGCRTDQVGSLREALDTVAGAQSEGDPFAVVLADARGASRGEQGLIEQLAQKSNYVVIALVADREEQTAEFLRGLGVRHLLTDPIRPSELLEAIQSVLTVSANRSLAKPTPALSADAPPLTGHILVAEDNRVNQMYIAELLKYFGCTCEVVANGKEAVTAASRNRYDLVLMDCQMPEMDGFTAVRELRSRETQLPEGERVSIIALTANALAGDRERCLQAGMDDYLSKPVDADALRRMLEKFLPDAGRSATASDAGA